MEALSNELLYSFFDYIGIIDAKFFRETNRIIADVGLSYFYNNYYFVHKRMIEWTEYQPYIKKLKTKDGDASQYPSLSSLNLNCKKIMKTAIKNNDFVTEVIKYDINDNITVDDDYTTKIGWRGVSMSKFIKPLIGLTELYLTNSSSFFEPNILPISLKKLVLDDYNVQLKHDVLPANLQYLVIGKYGYLLFLNTLPKSLKYLHIKKGFDKPIKPNVFPPSLTYLDLGFSYNQPLVAGCLPSSLHTVIFHGRFGQIITPGVLPPSLKSLTLRSYRHIIDRDSLPISLTSLNLNHCISQNTNDFAVSSLTNFRLNMRSVFLSENYLSNKLTTLIICGSDIKMFTPDLLPQSLTSLDLFSAYNNPFEAGILPSSLKILRFRQDYQYDFFPGILPISLETLIFFRNYTGKIYPGALPDSLRKLYFKGRYQLLSKDAIPKSLKFLQITNLIYLPYFIDSLNMSIFLSHLSLKNLTIKLHNTHDIFPIGYFPSNLESIHICCSGDYQTIIKTLQPGVFPTTLKKLHLCGIKEKLDAGILPDSLVELDIEIDREFPTKDDILPKSLGRLIVNDKYYNLSNNVINV